MTSRLRYVFERLASLKRRIYKMHFTENLGASHDRRYVLSRLITLNFATMAARIAGKSGGNIPHIVAMLQHRIPSVRAVLDEMAVTIPEQAGMTPDEQLVDYLIRLVQKFTATKIQNATRSANQRAARAAKGKPPYKAKRKPQSWTKATQKRLTKLRTLGLKRLSNERARLRIATTTLTLPDTPNGRPSTRPPKSPGSGLR